VADEPIVGQPVVRIALGRVEEAAPDDFGGEGASISSTSAPPSTVSTASGRSTNRSWPWPSEAVTGSGDPVASRLMLVGENGGEASVRQTNAFTAPTPQAARLR
jgi:hypothetical protein